MKHLVSIDQLSPEEINAVLARAGAYSDGVGLPRSEFSAALLMLQPSLRTHLGFAEAVRRLGGVAHAISRRKLVDASADESFADTLRVASGMTDLTIVRAETDLRAHTGHSLHPVINAGDNLEHPTQALIDLFAIQRLSGSWRDLSIGLCGDLNMRATRSLCKALAIVPPRRLRLFAPASRRGDAEHLLSPIKDRLEWGEGGDWRGLDVLHLGGLPERRGGDHLDRTTRAAYALSGANATHLEQHARVFSPMPVIDEVADELRADPRIAIYAQSDLSIVVRMAVLSLVLGL